MEWDNQISVLGVCLPESPVGSKPDAISFCAADSGLKALEMTRLLRFDLIIANVNIPDMPLWNLVGKIKAGCYWQKWAMVAEQINPNQELKARMLGCLTVLEATPTFEQLDNLVGALRRKASTAALRNQIAVTRAWAETGKRYSAV